MKYDTYVHIIIILCSLKFTEISLGHVLRTFDKLIKLNRVVQ